MTCLYFAIVVARSSGMLALAFALVHLRGHLLAGELQHLLWLSNVATLVLAVGCLAARASIVGLALLWLALDALLWTVDVAVAGAAVDHALHAPKTAPARRDRRRM